MERSGEGARRYEAFDALRAAMMCLGLVIHSSMSYVTADVKTVWPFKDDSHAVVFDLIVFVIHIFRMPVFFVMAGFFTALLVERTGMASTIANRSRRVLAPFVVGLIVLWPLVNGGFSYARRFNEPEFWEHWLTGSAPYASMSTGHLWFLYYLLYFYAGTVVVRAAYRTLPVPVRQRLGGAVSRLLVSPLRVVPLSVLTMASLLCMPHGILDTSVRFTPSIPVLSAYALFFAVGAGLFANRQNLAQLERHAWKQSLLALGLTVPFLGLVLKGLAQFPNISTPLFVGVAAFGAVIVWLAIFGLCGLFLRYFERPSRLVAYVSQASYWVYLVHLPAVIWGAGLLAPVALPAVVKFTVLLTGVSAVSFGTYQLFVRSTVIGAFLNGKRFTATEPSAISQQTA